MLSGQACSQQGKDKIRNCLYSKGRINPMVRTSQWPSVSDCQVSLIFVKAWGCCYPAVGSSSPRKPNTTSPIKAHPPLCLYGPHSKQLRRVLTCVSVEKTSPVFCLPCSILLSFNAVIFHEIMKENWVKCQGCYMWVHPGKCLASLYMVCHWWNWKNVDVFTLESCWIPVQIWMSFCVCRAIKKMRRCMCRFRK